MYLSQSSQGIALNPTAEHVKKWNPGHYMLIFLGESENIQGDQDLRFSYYDLIADSTVIKGVAIYPRWGQMEITEGDYSPGITFIQEELDKLASLTVPKQLWLHMTPQQFGDSVPEVSYFPQYIIDAGWVASTSNQAILEFWTPAAVDKYIGLIRALGAAFDSHPNFEGITLNRETAFGQPVPGNFVRSVYYSELERLGVAGLAAFPTANVTLAINWAHAGPISGFSTLVSNMRDLGLGITGPDVSPDTAIPVYDEIVNLPYYPKSPVMFRIEGSELGFDSVGPVGGYLPTTLFDFCEDTLKCSYIFWQRMVTFSDTAPCDSSGACEWTPGILPFINANPTVTHTTLPETYGRVPFKKWHPGHYIQFSVIESKDVNQSFRFGIYDDIAANTQIKGACVRVKWAALESTQGVYTFDTMSTEINKLKNLSSPKRLFIRLLTGVSKSGGDPCATTEMFPPYLRTGSNAACALTTSGNTIRLWNSFVRNRIIALYEAMAARWDDDPFFEGIYLIRETAKNGSLVDSDPEFSDDNYIDGLKIIATGADNAFVKSNAVMSANFAGGNTRLATLMDHLNTLDIGFGGPDVFPTGICTNRSADADEVFVGSEGTDYRGAIPSLRSMESGDMNGGLGTCTPQQIRDHANDELHASHLFWTHSNNIDATRNWDTGVLPLINDTANDLTHIQAPTNYAQGVDTS